MCFFGCSSALGVVGIGSYVAFLLYQILKPKEIHQPHHQQVEKDIEADKKETHEGQQEHGDHSSESEEEQPTYKGLLYLFLGGAIIFIFSEPFITSVVTVANMANVNPILFAFFLAPVASEMPEILESISLSRKGKLQNINIAVSNLVGGTITKTTFLCGIFSFYGVYKGFPWEHPNFTISYVLLTLCSCVAASSVYFVKSHTVIYSYILFGTFIIAGLFQYIYNSS